MRSGRILILLVAFTLLATGTGCDRTFRLANLASFSAGWLVGQLTTPITIDTVCYRNGELIDCSELPWASSELIRRATSPRYFAACNCCLKRASMND